MGLKHSAPSKAPVVLPKRQKAVEDLTPIRELISRRRRQLMVHSEVYYRHNENLIADHDFDRWSKELVELQNKYPQVAAECPFHELFKDFDGSTGFHLCGHPWGVAKANYLLQIHRKGIAI